MVVYLSKENQRVLLESKRNESYTKYKPFYAPTHHYSKIEELGENAKA